MLWSIITPMSRDNRESGNTNGGLQHDQATQGTSAMAGPGLVDQFRS